MCKTFFHSTHIFHFYFYFYFLLFFHRDFFVYIIYKHYLHRFKLKMKVFDNSGVVNLLPIKSSITLLKVWRTSWMRWFFFTYDCCIKMSTIIFFFKTDFINKFNKRESVYSRVCILNSLIRLGVCVFTGV